MEGLLDVAEGRTLRELKGSPAGIRRRPGATIGLVVGPGLAALAFVASFLALVETQAGFPDAGVASENPGGRVLSVSVHGFAWKDGIRLGQEVIALRGADEAGGWAIQTRDGGTGTLLVSDSEVYTTALRGIWPIAAIGVILSVGAVASASRRRMELLAALAIVVSAIPTELRGQPTLAPVVGAMAVLAPTFWLTRWSRIPRPILGLVAGASILLLIAWVVAVLMTSESYDTFNDVRHGYTVALGAGMVLVGPGLASRPTLESVRHLRGPDLAVAAGLIAVIAVLQVFAIVPLFVSAILAIAAVALYSRRRGMVVASLDRLFLGDMRERASLDAIESERSRLARDLHDEPLQQLAGVIKRLEARPETAEETDLLRSVADQLRGVATELHPPVLDDLGLVPSIEFLAARGPEDVQVSVAISSEGDYASSARPPANVELAVFRIVQEAVANAIEHAKCSEIVIDGSVSADRIDLRIADDGVGLTDREMSRAMRDGRLGLASMRRRAEAIDAVLEIQGRPGKGTTLKVAWSA
jgi:signal transduction histidine kinase